MQVKDRLSGAFAVVGHQPVIFQSLLASHLARDPEQVSEELLITRVHSRDIGARLARDDQDMGRGLGLNVPEGERLFVLVDDVGGNFLVDDLLKNSAHALSFVFRRRAPRGRHPILDLARLKCENACA